MLPTGLSPLPGTEALTMRTERLGLVPITRKHAPAMFEVLKDPALYEYVSGSPPVDVAALTPAKIAQLSAQYKSQKTL